MALRHHPTRHVAAVLETVRPGAPALADGVAEWANYTFFRLRLGAQSHPPSFGLTEADQQQTYRKHQ
jgi:hypothetical protein